MHTLQRRCGKALAHSMAYIGLGCTDKYRVNAANGVEESY